MNKTVTNIFLILGITTVCFGGYYLFIMNGESVGLVDVHNEAELQAMLKRTQVFIDHRQTLDAVAFDFSILDDSSFRLLESFRTPIVTQPIGRSNPFEPREAPVPPSFNDTASTTDNTTL